MPGCVQGTIVHLVCQSVPLYLSVCVKTFLVFTGCESCTRPFCTNPGTIAAGEYGLTRGTCVIACCLESDAVAGMLWISWCVFGGADFSVFLFSIFFLLRTYTACCKYEAASCLIYLSTSIGGEQDAII